MATSEFRLETREWLETNLPASIVGRGEGYNGGTKRPTQNPDSMRWLETCYEKGYTVPTWPKEYGGAGLNTIALKILREEMRTMGAPVPLSGHGVTMIGPTLLEYGTEDQKRRHLPRIASGELRWCQGYSEPNSGSDLASLQTRAEDHGDYYLVNGSKIWTSGAHYADWIFCLVRTNFKNRKQEGISFLLFPIDSPGVTVQPITLIDGSAEFCQCFFDQVRVNKNDLVHRENDGWTVAKRLLQYERMVSDLDGTPTPVGTNLVQLALAKSGSTEGRILEEPQREKVVSISMDQAAFALTQKRTTEENASGTMLTFATSMFKYYATELSSRRMEAILSTRGTDGLGWEGGIFETQALSDTRSWLMGKSGTIAAGSSEIQLNIIAKRVLGLPD